MRSCETPHSLIERTGLPLESSLTWRGQPASPMRRCSSESRLDAAPTGMTCMGANGAAACGVTKPSTQSWPYALRSCSACGIAESSAGLRSVWSSGASALSS